MGRGSVSLLSMSGLDTYGGGASSAVVIIAGELQISVLATGSSSLLLDSVLSCSLLDSLSKMTPSCSVMLNLMSPRYGLPSESCLRLYQVPSLCTTANALVLLLPEGLYTRNVCPLLLWGFLVDMCVT